MKNIGILTFDQMFQKKNTGSSRIRATWLIKYWEEAEKFQQGKLYDIIIFQKAYFKEMAKEFNGIKILDICDPDWLDGMEVVSFCKYVDSITVPTEALKLELENMTDKPVFIVKDRIDLETIPDPKVHIGRAKKCVWFGYSHNSDVLDPTLMKIRSLGLELMVISDGNYTSGECKVENIKWDVETVNSEIQKADFVLLPKRLSGKGKYKSENKIVQSWALGMPVAESPEDMERFMNEEERIKEAEEKRKFVFENYDVKDSVKEMKVVIESIKK